MLACSAGQSVRGCCLPTGQPSRRSWWSSFTPPSFVDPYWIHVDVSHTYTHPYRHTQRHTERETHTHTQTPTHPYTYTDRHTQRRKEEGNVLFNDTLNTFYLRLYGVGHMVKDHTDSERANLLPPHGLLFPISSIIPQTG